MMIKNRSALAMILLAAVAGPLSASGISVLPDQEVIGYCHDCSSGLEKRSAEHVVRPKLGVPRTVYIVDSLADTVQAYRVFPWYDGPGRDGEPILRNRAYPVASGKHYANIEAAVAWTSALRSGFQGLAEACTAEVDAFSVLMHGEIVFIELCVNEQIEAAGPPHLSGPLAETLPIQASVIDHYLLGFNTHVASLNATTIRVLIEDKVWTAGPIPYFQMRHLRNHSYAGNIRLPDTKLIMITKFGSLLEEFSRDQETVDKWGQRFITLLSHFFDLSAITIEEQRGAQPNTIKGSKESLGSLLTNLAADSNCALVPDGVARSGMVTSPKFTIKVICD